MNLLTLELFIRPGVDLAQGDPDYTTVISLQKEDLRKRWRTTAGAAILAEWRANNFDRQILDSRIGKFYGHTDLRGVPEWH